MKLKNVLVLLILLAIGTGLGISLPTVPKQSQGEQGIQGEQGKQGIQGIRGLQGLPGKDGKDAKPALGAVTGPELSSPFWTVDGVRTWYLSAQLNASSASTTICTWKLPNATTTPKLVTAQITTASSTALQFEWGTSALQAATTTSLGVANIGSGVKATIVASTTAGHFAAADNIDPAFLLSPNNYLTLKFGGSAVGGGLKGTCKAELLEN